MGLLKIFRSAKSNSGGEQANRSHSFSSSVGNDDAPLAPPARIGKDSRSVSASSTSSVRSSSSFLGSRNSKDRSASQHTIKTIPYDSTPPQRPPQPRATSGSSQPFSPNTAHPQYGHVQHPSRLHSVQNHGSPDVPSPNTPRHSESHHQQKARPFSKYVLPDLDLDSGGAKSGSLADFPGDGAGKVPSPRDMAPSQRLRMNSDRSWSSPVEQIVDKGRSSSNQPQISPSESRRPDLEESKRERPLPEPPGAVSRPGSTLAWGPSASSTSSVHDQSHSHSSASASASSGSATPRPSLSVNPVVLAEPSGKSEINRPESHLAPPSASNASERTNSNQSVFPWLNRSRSKSPNTLGAGGLLDQGSITMVKSKSKDKGKAKSKTGDEDGSFRVRAFRHVSSGSGIPPWEVQFEHENTHTPQAGAAEAESQRSESDPAIPYRSDFHHEGAPPESSDSSSPQRPGLQGLGRPPSVAGSMNSEDRQVSVQRFKQTRRYSGISANGVHTFPSEMNDQTPYQSHGYGHHRVRSDSSGVEVLASPQKKRTANLGSDSSDEEILAPSRYAGKEELYDRSAPSRAMNRSFSTSALSAVSPTGTESPAAVSTIGRRSLDQSLTPGSVNHPPRGLSGFTVQNRRAVSGFDQCSTSLVNRGTFASESGTRPFGHDRSRSTSGMQDLAAEISDARRTSGGATAANNNRLTLHERLAGLAVSTPPVTDLPLVSSPDCEIPPVRSPSPQTCTSPSVITRPSSAQASVTPRSIVQQRSVSNMSTSRQKARTGWDASSSDEESDKDKKTLRKTRTASSSKAPQPTFKVQSLPSGVRRPPAPSEAFGPDEDESPRRTSVAGSQGSRASSFSSNLGPQPSSFQRAKISGHSRDPSNAVADSDDESTDSSEDEPLTAIKHKQSSSSLASGASLTVPGGRPKVQSQHSSPAKSSRSNSNMSLAPVTSSPQPARSAISTTSLPTGSSGLSPSRRSSRLPIDNATISRPPTTLVTAGLRTRDSPASSQSGATTGDTSSGGLPVTPRELSMALSNPIAVNSARSSFSSTQLANNPRRVSFAEDERGQVARNAEGEAGKEQIRRTNERRREEARKATEIGQTATGTPEAEQDAPPDPAMYLQQMQAQMPQFGQMANAFNPYFGMSNAGFMDPTQQMFMLQMQMAQMAQMAQNPAMMQMQQQAIALAKQQYQASVVAAAMQAAEDAWERGSNMTGLGSTTGRNLNPLSQMSPGNTGFPMGMPGVFPAMSVYGNAGSAYGGNASVQAGSPHFNASSAPRPPASVYGESYGARPTVNAQPVPHRSRSSPSLDRLMAEQSGGHPRPALQHQPNPQRPLPAPSARRPAPKSMVPTKGPDNETPRSAPSTYSSTPPAAVAMPPSSWRTRSSGDYIR